MANSIRDDNYVAVLMGQSSADQSVPIPIKIDPVTGAVLCESATWTVVAQYINDDWGFSWSDYTSVQWITWGLATASPAGINDYGSASTF